MKPKFVYFDLGGVAILDFSKTNKWQELRRELGVSPERDPDFVDLWSQYSDRICIDLDVDTLLPIIKQKFGPQLSPSYSLLIDGFVNRFAANESIWPVMNEIHRSCKVGLLTNAYLRMYQAVKERGILPEVTWDTLIDSSVVGLQKPDPRIYNLAEEKADSKGSEILFVENSPEHVNAAKAFDWQTFLYDPANPEDSSSKLLKFYKNL